MKESRVREIGPKLHRPAAIARVQAAVQPSLHLFAQQGKAVLQEEELLSLPAQHL